MRDAAPFLAVLIAAAALTASPGAEAKLIDSSPSGFTLENTVVVAADADRAWSALVGDVEAWWPRDHRWWDDSRLEIEARAGGCFCERAGDRQAQHLQVTFVDPGKTLRLVGGLGPLQGMGLHGALEFRLAPAGDGRTRITLWYRAGGYTPDDLSKFAPVVDRVQAQQLGGLADHLGGALPDEAEADADAEVDADADPAPADAGG